MKQKPYLTDLFILKPVWALAITIAILIVGVLSYLNLPVRQFPVVNLPIISIVTKYPGASPSVMEGFVSTPIENALTGIDGIDYIKTANEQGVSGINVWLKAGTPPDKALTEISAKVSSILWKLPQGVLAPAIERTTKGTPVVFIALGSNTVSTEAISDYLNRIVIPQFAAIPGVMKFLIKGQRDYAMRIWLDPIKVAQYGMTVPEAIQAVLANSHQAAVGKLKNNNAEYNLNINSSLSQPAQFDQVAIKTVHGRIIRLKDIGYASLGAQSNDTSFQFQGYKNGIVFGAVPDPTANNIEVAKRVLVLAAKLRQKLPPGVHMRILWNTAKFSQEAVKLVYDTIWLAILCVVIVIFGFLGSLRTLLIPIVVIPCSLIGACIFMRLFGFSLNMLTLLAFVLAIGLVVDDSIVVVENIHRNMVNGMEAIKAAVIGTREISLAVLAMSAVVIIVILPIGFTTGLTGVLFKEFAFTLAMAVFLSAVFALILSPMLSSKLIRVHSGCFDLAGRIEHVLERLATGYAALLRHVVKFNYLFIILIIAVGSYCFWLLQKTPSELIPDENQGVILVIAQGPTMASLPYMSHYGRQILDIIEKVPEGKRYGVINGFDGVTKSLAFITLRKHQKGDRSEQQIIDTLRGKMQKIPGVIAFAMNRPPLLDVTGFEAPVQFVLQTTGSYEELYRVMAKLLAAAEKNPNLLNVDSDLKINKPELQVTVNRQRAASMGVPMQSITESLEYLLAKPMVSWYSKAGWSYPIIPQIYNNMRVDPHYLNSVYVRNIAGQMVPLSNLVHYKVEVAPQKLNHFQKLRSATLTAQLAQGYTLGQALTYLQQAADKILPNNMAYDYASTSRQYIEASGKMTMIFIIALFAIYLLLTMKFNSFVEPLVVMLCVPLSSAGALTAMHLSGATLNIFTQIGLVMLVGLISKHGILIISFAHHMQQQGENIVDSIIHAAKIRLRPVLMTTGAMIFGAIPLVLAGGSGSVSLHDIGWVIIGGLSFGSLMTLFVVPSMYSLLIRKPKRDKTLELEENDHA